MADSTVKVNFLGDASSLKRASDDADGHLGKIGASIGNLAKTAAVGFAAIAVGAGAFAKSAIGAATDLGESLNAVDKIFGESAKTIKDWGKENANSFGLSRAEFNKLATPLGALLKNSGLSMDKVADNTINLTKRAADLASVFNVDVSEALEAINSGLKGEADPLEKFGIGLSAAKVEAAALAATGKKNAKALTEQEKAMARINLIMKESASVQGDFAGTSDQLANKTRILKARFTDFKAEIGTQLIPIALAMANVFGNVLMPLMGRVAAVVSRAVAQFSEAFTHMRKGGWEAHGTMESLGVTAAKVFLWMKDNIPPILQAIAGFIRQHVIPAIGDLVGWFRDHLLPAVGKMADSFMKDLWPAIERDVLPALGKLAKFIKEEVLPRLGDIVTFIIDKVLPALFRIVAWVIEDAIPKIAEITVAFWKFVVDVKEVCEDVADFFSELGPAIAAPFINAIEWIDKLLNKMGALGTTSLMDLDKKIPGPRVNWDTSIIDLIKGKASGGPVAGGRPYIVGERGPELFVPGSSGGIVPNHALGGSQSISLNIDGRSFMTWLVDYSRDAGGVPITTRAPS